MKLRPYQNQGIEEIFDNFHKGNRSVILYGQTGLGKTEMMCAIALDCLKNGFPCVLIVRGRELVKNLSHRLDKYKIDHAVFMAGHHRYSPGKTIQVCSVDTLKSRSVYPYAERECLVILDEQHKNYDTVYEAYKMAFFVGASGTPFNRDQNKHYTAIVNPIQGFELRDQGFLVPEVIYCPNLVDTSSVKIVAGDFKRDQLETLMSDSKIVGDIISDYIKYGESRPSICFAVSVEHSKRLRDAFLANNIPAVHCDANSTEQERDSAKAGLENGKIKVVCNVDIFSVGFDCPIVSCIILGRPTWSLIWYLQAIGRGLRSHSTKRDCIILDNAGNVFRHSTPYRVREAKLGPEESKKKTRQYDESIRNCTTCFRIINYSDLLCPHCGTVQEIKRKEVREVAGELKLYKESELERKERQIKECKTMYGKLEWTRRSKGFKTYWTFYQLEKKFDKEIIATLSTMTKIPSKFLPNQGKA